MMRATWSVMFNRVRFVRRTNQLCQVHAFSTTHDLTPLTTPSPIISDDDSEDEGTQDGGQITIT